MHVDRGTDGIRTFATALIACLNSAIVDVRGARDTVQGKLEEKRPRFVPCSCFNNDIEQIANPKSHHHGYIHSTSTSMRLSADDEILGARFLHSELHPPRPQINKTNWAKPPLIIIIPRRPCVPVCWSDQTPPILFFSVCVVRFPPRRMAATLAILIMIFSRIVCQTVACSNMKSASLWPCGICGAYIHWYMRFRDGTRMECRPTRMLIATFTGLRDLSNLAHFPWVNRAHILLIFKPSEHRLNSEKPYALLY